MRQAVTHLRQHYALQWPKRAILGERVLIYFHSLILDALKGKMLRERCSDQ